MTEVQFKRRINGATGSPAAAGALEGSIALNFPGAAGGTATPEIWAFDGVAYRRANPSLNIRNWAIAGTGANPAADAGNQAANPAAFTVNAGELIIASHNGSAYVFTGGAGTWGDPAIGGTPIPVAPGSAMFTALGSSFTFDVEYKDFDTDAQVVAAGVAPADVGAAYTVAAAAPANFGYSGALVIAQYRDEKYILTTPATPGAAASYVNLGGKATSAGVLDLTAVAGGPHADVAAAYAAWLALPVNAGTPLDTVQMAQFGSPVTTYLLTNPAAPTNVASWAQVAQTPTGITFRSPLDLTAAYPDDANNPPDVAWNAGDFGIVSASGAIVNTDSADGKDWTDYGLTNGAAVKQGDLVFWDGTNFYVVTNEVDLSAYLPLSGGTLTMPATPAPAAGAPTLIFDLTNNVASAAAQGGHKVAADFGGGEIRNGIVDGGTF